MSIQSDTLAAGELCYLFRRLISLADTKASVLEWLEQFQQLSSSLDIEMPEEDVEWLVAKAWNTVRCWAMRLIVHCRERRQLIYGSRNPACARAFSVIELKTTTEHESLWMWQ